MKVQLLAFPGCPNAGAARIALREALEREHVRAGIEEVDVSRDDAPPWSNGWGSPTILIDGVDVAGERSSAGEVSCRLYPSGAPSIDQIRERIRAARGATADRRRRQWPIVGAVLAALAASACCVIPAMLAIVGASGAGVASVFAPFRPYLLALTALALAAGFYLAYRPSRAVNACGCGTPRRRRAARLGLWLGAVVAVGVAGYPRVFAAHTSVHRTTHGSKEITLHVTGMDCRACTKKLAKRLSRVSGVATVDVDYDRGLAVVTYGGKRDLSAELIDAVEDLGYGATIDGLRRSP